MFEFPYYNFEVLVSENETNFKAIGWVKATDRDSGENAKLVYRLIGAGGAFSIDAQTGEIKTTTRLDPEETDCYEFQVCASDLGKTRLESCAMVQVKLIDIVNRHSPIFIYPTSENNTLRVSLSTPIGQEIARMKAVDDDFYHNGEVQFKISGGNELNLFALDAITGSLSFNIPLKFHLTESVFLKLFITAHDSGKPKKESIQALNVELFPDLAVKSPNNVGKTSINKEVISKNQIGDYASEILRNKNFLVLILIGIIILIFFTSTLIYIICSFRRAQTSVPTGMY